MTMKYLFSKANVLISSVTSLASAGDFQGRSEATGDDAPWKMAFVGDVRSGGFVRSNTQYFNESSVFGYPVSHTAAGIRVDLGAELLPRFSLVGSASYFGDGAQRRFAKLML